jgi:hypothetical protein
LGFGSWFLVFGFTAALFRFGKSRHGSSFSSPHTSGPTMIWHISGLTICYIEISPPVSFPEKSCLTLGSEND